MLLSTKKTENNSEDAEAKVVQAEIGSGKWLLSTKKAENSSEDAEAQVAAQGQK
jgi:hypothetical protein